jgi:propanediol dehydratase large subunit
MPARNVVEDLKSAEDMMKRGTTGVDIVKALSKGGFEDVADAVFGMLKQRVAGDYLQTSAILTRNFEVISAVNQPNDYRGPQTGYQISDERWAILQNIRQAISPESI